MDASPHDLLGLACGMIVGLSLGLTGGGGSIFAVPRLMAFVGLRMWLIAAYMLAKNLPVFFKT